LGGEGGVRPHRVQQHRPGAADEEAEVGADPGLDTVLGLEEGLGQGHQEVARGRRGGDARVVQTSICREKRGEWRCKKGDVECLYRKGMHATCLENVSAAA